MRGRHGGAGPTRGSHEQRPLYGRAAWAYDAVVPDRSIEQARWVASVLPPAGDVLDAGCGTGRVLEQLLRLGRAVIGVDLSLDALRHAHERRSGARSLVAGDLAALPLASGRFGGVLCRGVLNDVLDDETRDKALAELARVLRRSGRLVLDVRDWNRTLERYRTGATEHRTVESTRGEIVFETTTHVDERTQGVIIEETLRTAAEQWTTVFNMRCWTASEVRERLRRAGLGVVALTAGDGVIWPADRLVVVGETSALCTPTTSRRPKAAERSRSMSSQAAREPDSRDANTKNETTPITTSPATRPTPR